MDMSAEMAAIEMAGTTEGALAILRQMLFRPRARANGKTIITATVNMALARAIAALEKELKEEKENGIT